MVKFYAYTDSEIQHKQKIMDFLGKFHKEHPRFTFSVSDLINNGHLVQLFRILGVNHFRLVAKFNKENDATTLYKQADPELKTISSLRHWLQQKDVHICMGESGLPVTFKTMWNRVLKMNKKNRGFNFEAYPGTFSPIFKAPESDYESHKKVSDAAAKYITFPNKPGSFKFHKYYMVPHVYVVSHKNAYKIAKEFISDLRTEFHDEIKIPKDSGSRTLLCQLMVKEFRLTLVKMNNFTRPVVYVRAAYTVVLDIALLTSKKYVTETWKKDFHKVDGNKVKNEFVNDALIPNYWFTHKPNQHKGYLAIDDFNGKIGKDHRYIYDIKVPSVSNKGAYSILEFDIIPNEKPVTDSRTNEVLKPMTKKQFENYRAAQK